MMTRKYCPVGLSAISPQAWGGDYPCVVTSTGVQLIPYGSSQAAVVSIDGPLTHKPMGWFDCYGSIARRIEAALQCAEASCVILRIDSPGGDVSGCFELARSIRGKAEKGGGKKPIGAYIDGVGASAAYAIACACDWVIAPPSALVGSIGIVEAVVSQVAADQAQGLQFLFATSGERKADGNPHVPITEDAAAALQSHVDELALLFFALVAEMRQTTVDAVRDLQAGIFLATVAQEHGLIDQVATFDQLIESMGAESMSFPNKPKAEMAPPAEESGKAKLRKMIAAEMAEASEEDRKLYTKMLANLDDKPAEESAPDSKKAETEEKDAEVKAAKAEDERKDAEAKAAAAIAQGNFDAAKEIFALKASLQAERDQLTRDRLFATRPDFDPATKAMMAAWPVEQVEAAVKTFPRVVAAPAATVAGTVGANQHKGKLSDEEAFIDRKMGRTIAGGSVTNAGAHLTLGYMTPAQASAHLAQLEAAQKGAQ